MFTTSRWPTLFRFIICSDHTPSLKRTLAHSSSRSQSTPSPPKVPRFASTQPASSFSFFKAQDPLPLSHTRLSKTLQQPLPVLAGPLHDKAYIISKHRLNLPIKSIHETSPKASLANYALLTTQNLPAYNSTKGMCIDKSKVGAPSLMYRCTVTVPSSPSVAGIGDHTTKKEAEKLAALSAVYQLHSFGLLDGKKAEPKKVDSAQITLSDGSTIGYERARSFMDYYCRRYKFSKLEVAFSPVAKPSGNAWDAVMTVGGRRIGLGSAGNKKAAQIACYLDVTQYLESCDPELWKTFVEASKSGADLGLAPRVYFRMSDFLDDSIRDLCHQIRQSKLWRNRPAVPGSSSISAGLVAPSILRSNLQQRTEGGRAGKSEQLLRRHQEYLADPAMEAMRKTRASLPVYTFAEDLISHISQNEVTICLAATGSGKTTQVPQLILDAYIARGEGSLCNVVCTQPRRLAAVSIAHRVARERGEVIGRSVGYQVRFEANLPEEHGSITFCTTGVFLKKLQSALSEESTPRSHSLDDVTHIIVDEVHERDVDTDLLLVVLKRLLADRKARKRPLQVILMSATIDPSLFQQYFSDNAGQSVKLVDIPGRSFPVTQYFLDDFASAIANSPARWVLRDDSVAMYLTKELGTSRAATLGITDLRSASEGRDDLELPYPFIAATIAHVLNSSDDGHVLVFLPGWDEIIAVQRILRTPIADLGVNFNDSSKIAIHLLHSTIPLVEQQAIFDPPPPGVRRIILATNIAETSVTIPDVVYVVDSAKVKEQRYDPERRMSSLVSAWVGSSNLRQRAGRAGRHRPGEYFGILGRVHAEGLNPYQTVEMKRVDLSNIVMHVKALNFPGMSVEEALAATIEPPLPERVAAAMKDLQVVGALDADKNITSLGRILLQLPVDVQMGRMVLYGSFFCCLDEALTLAAILTNRDPFLSPMHLKAEAAARKNSWTPPLFRSDALAALYAFNTWYAMQSRGEHVPANRFCVENFLAKPTLLMIQKVKMQLLQSLYHLGVIEVSGGGLRGASASSSKLAIPPELNVNRGSLPLLAALICIASQPSFAVRTGRRVYRTSQDKTTFIHPSSVNSPKQDHGDLETSGERQLIAFAEKRQNISTGRGDAQTFLVTTTRLDPLPYMLFGAYKLGVVESGLECDSWLPITGNIVALDSLQRLKTLIEGCMLRVFEGIAMGRRRWRRNLPVLSREEPESESENEDEDWDYSLTREETQELDRMTHGVVRILERNSDKECRQISRPGTRPISPDPMSPQNAGRSSSEYSTPRIHGRSRLRYSRPSTPGKQSRRL